jgi:hypothetical protein
MTSRSFRTLAVFLGGFLLGAAFHGFLFAPAQLAHAQATKAAPDIVQLAAEIESIKGKLPSQSHTMQDVSYHFGNLWFAGQQENWDLANFYLSETRSHLHWAVRIIPVRKDNAGHEVVLGDILEAFENGPLKKLGETIATHDKSAFVKEYRDSLATCYDCHKAADKPYLRPQIPTQPESPIVNFDPAADWPK